MNNKKFLLIYGIIIIILLLGIMFFIPDDFFKKQYDDIEIPTTEKKDFVSYETQIENLLNKQYEYEYLILDSIGTKSYTYECSGKMDDTIESGTCTKPKKISYTEQNKKDVYKEIEINYIDVEYIFNSIKDIEPTIEKMTKTRIYTYKTAIEKLETDITVTTDLDAITQIEISNAYMTYILKYNNVNIDN